MNGDCLSSGDGIPRALGHLRARFEQWRQRNGLGHRRRIPADLWEEASVLARELGVFRVASTLQLDYATLKQRAGDHLPQRPQHPPDPFVELTLPGPESGPQQVIELVNRQGARLTLRLHALESQALLDLAEVFLRKRP